MLDHQIERKQFFAHIPFVENFRKPYSFSFSFLRQEAMP